MNTYPNSLPTQVKLISNRTSNANNSETYNDSEQSYEQEKVMGKRNKREAISEAKEASWEEESQEKKEKRYVISIR